MPNAQNTASTELWDTVRQALEDYVRPHPGSFKELQALDSLRTRLDVAEGDAAMYHECRDQWKAQAESLVARMERMEEAVNLNREHAERAMAERDELKGKLAHALEGLAHPFAECRCPR